MNKPFAELKRGERNICIPSHKQAVMTGLDRIEQQRSGRITLFYLDGAKSSALCPGIEVKDVTCENFFSVVHYVQSKSRDFPHLFPVQENAYKSAERAYESRIQNPLGEKP